MIFEERVELVIDILLLSSSVIVNPNCILIKYNILACEDSHVYIYARVLLRIMVENACFYG